VAILLSLATGPLMILGMLLAIPVALVLMALGGVTLAFFLWTLYWAFVWLIGADPDAPHIFLQSLGITCGFAAVMTALMWGMFSFKDWLFSKSSRANEPPQVPHEQRVIHESNEDVIQPKRIPANDWTPQR
jgi:hypothetical protein